MVSVRLLGPFELQEEGREPIRRFRSRSAASVLAYLAVHADRAVAREEIVEAVWPEDDPEQARASLRTALHSFRGLTSVEVFGADRQFVWLNRENVSVDLHEFDRTARAGRAAADPAAAARSFDEAVLGVRGPLLPAATGIWVAAHQLAFEESYCQVVAARVELFTQQHEFEAAISLGRGALRLFPLREELHVALIKALNLSGQRGEAIRQFETLESWLDEQWGEAPSAEAVKALDTETRPERPTPTPTRAAVETDTPDGTRLPSLGRRVFGREAEIARLADAVLDGAGPRVLTVAGAGGCGKTLLALAVAHRVCQTLGPRVSYVELAGLDDPRLVASRIAESLKLPNPGTPDVVERIGEAVAGSPWLILLDNAEHLLPGLGDEIERLSSACPDLRLLVTSRVTMDLDIERVFPTSLLPLPSDRATLAEIAEVPAVALFVDRVLAQRPDFSLNAGNVRAVIELCHRMEGLPLALELAAAQTAVMTPAQVLVRLDDQNFRLRTSGRSGPDRHRSLQAVLDRSYSLLPDETQRFYRALSVFRASFTLEAAESISADPDAVDRLRDLVLASLVERVEAFDSVRFHILRPLHSYAWAKAVETGEAEALRERHRDWAVTVAVRQRKEFDGPRAAQAGNWLEAEHDNFRQVVDTAVERRDWADEALLIGSCLVYFIRMRGFNEEWIQRLTRVFQFAEGRTSEAMIARGTSVLGNLCTNLSRHEESYTHFQRAVEIFDRVGKPVDQAAARSNLSIPLVALARNDEAIASLEEGLSRLGDSTEEGVWKPEIVRSAIEGNLAMLYRQVDRQDEAIEILTRLAERCERDGARRFLPSITIAIGLNHLDKGETETAVQTLRRGAAYADELGFIADHAEAQGYLSWAAGQAGDGVRCVEHGIAAARLGRTGQLDHFVGVGFALVALGVMLRDGVDPARPFWAAAHSVSGQLASEFVAWQHRLVEPLGPPETAEGAADEGLVQATLDAAIAWLREHTAEPSPGVANGAVR